MARTKSIGIRAQLTSLISTRELNQFARWTGVVRRRRKIEPMALFWTIVLGFAGGRHRSLAALRRAYEKSTGTRLVPSAFYDRFTASMAEYFRTVTGVLLEKLQEKEVRLAGVLASFRDVIVPDSTLVRLHELLERSYPGSRTNHTKAAAKLHVVMSVKGEGPRTVRITSGRQHDCPVLRVGPWVRDRLLLFDLGYFRYGLFERIGAHGGYFISRLKEGTNPLITRLLRDETPHGVPIVGEKLRGLVGRLRREELDVEVELTFRRRAYAGTRSGHRLRVRLVGVRDAETGRYHLYLTNIPAERLSAREISAIYAGRWQVELLFREMKSHYRLSEIPSRKRHIVETLLYASVLTLLASRRLLQAVREKLNRAGRSVPEQRWASIFTAASLSILEVLLAPATLAKEISRRLEPMMLHEATDPNVTRRLLLARVENADTW